MSLFNLFGGSGRRNDKDFARLLPQCRSMLKKDLPTVGVIAKKCFDNPWCYEEFHHALRYTNVGAYVRIDEANRLVGFCVYAAHADYYHILTLAVLPVLQHRGHGTAMVHYLADRLAYGRRERIVADVYEDRPRTRIFLTNRHFRCIFGGSPERPVARYELRLASLPIHAAEAVCNEPDVSGVPSVGPF